MLMLCLDANCVEAEGSSLGSIVLYPGSTIELKRPDRCDVVTNTTSDTVVPLPPFDKAWESFARGGYVVIDIKECGKQ